MTSIGNYAFEGCSGLTSSINIPNSVASNGDCAFEGCKFKGIEFNTKACETSCKFSSTLESLTIGEDVTMIPDLTFSECPNLADVYCYAKEPFKIQGTTFKMYNKLHVLTRCEASYANQYLWK